MFTKRPSANSDESLSPSEALPPPTLDLKALEPEPAAVPCKQRSVTTSSVIGPELTVAGNVTSNGKVHIDGRIEGDVHCTCVTIGETAIISGSVKADEIAVNGQIRGNIQGDHVTLQPKARVSGDIHHRSLAIAQGAQFEGWARRSKDPDGVDTKSLEAALRNNQAYEPVVLDAMTLNELPNPVEAASDPAERPDDEAGPPQNDLPESDTMPPPDKAANGLDELEKPGPLH